MNFQILPLPLHLFQPLFGLSDEELAKRASCRMIVDANPGFPCRVSLRDAEIGERVLLLNYVHQSAESPYRATGAIFVRENAVEAKLEPGEIPEAVARRTISVRAYDSRGMMKGARLVNGDALEVCFKDLFAN